MGNKQSSDSDNDDIKVVEVVPKFSIGDKISYPYNEVRSLGTITGKVNDTTYEIKFDGLDDFKLVDFNNPLLEKADFSRVERNWVRMNRDSDRRKAQEKIGYKCECDPAYECICDIKPLDMKSRADLPKENIHDSLNKFIIKYTGEDRKFRYRGDYDPSINYTECDVVRYTVLVYMTCQEISNKDPLSGFPWVKADEYTYIEFGKFAKFVGLMFMKETESSDPVDIQSLPRSPKEPYPISSPDDEEKSYLIPGEQGLSRDVNDVIDTLDTHPTNRNVIIEDYDSDSSE